MLDADPVAKIHTWIQEIVIGHHLCPFAALPYRAGRVKLAMCTQADTASQADLMLDEMDHLIQDEHAEVSTTLIAYPHGLGAFDDFLDFVDLCEALAKESGATAFVQFAHFHPDYQFEGTQADEGSNYTNRSPVPIVQLLRTEEVALAVAKGADTAFIPQRNVAHFDALGPGALWQLWSRLFGQR